MTPHTPGGGLGQVLGQLLTALGTLTVFGGPKAIGIDLGSGAWYWVAGGCLLAVGAFVGSASTVDDGRRGSGPLFLLAGVAVPVAAS